jgi:hypothetical protein
MSSFTEKMESLKNVKILMKKQSQSSSPSPASSIVPLIDENVIDNDEQLVGGTWSWAKPLDSALAVQPSSSSSSSNSSSSSSTNNNATTSSSSNNTSSSTEARNSRSSNCIPQSSSSSSRRPEHTTNTKSKPSADSAPKNQNAPPKQQAKKKKTTKQTTSSATTTSNFNYTDNQKMVYWGMLPGFPTWPVRLASQYEHELLSQQRDKRDKKREDHGDRQVLLSFLGSPPNDMGWVNESLIFELNAKSFSKHLQEKKMVCNDPYIALKVTSFSSCLLSVAYCLLPVCFLFAFC